MNQTLVLCKPDAVERKLVGKIISRFEEKGLSVSSMRMLTITPDIAALHYAEHVGKPFYDDLVTFIGRSNSVAMVIEGPDDTWEIVRKMMGATNAAEAEPGTIRGDYALTTQNNIIHASDSVASAEREITNFFG